MSKNLLATRALLMPCENMYVWGKENNGNILKVLAQPRSSLQADSFLNCLSVVPQPYDQAGGGKGRR
jgi:hypothetical protein